MTLERDDADGNADDVRERNLNHYTVFYLLLFPICDSLYFVFIKLFYFVMK